MPETDQNLIRTKVIVTSEQTMVAVVDSSIELLTRN